MDVPLFSALADTGVLGVGSESAFPAFGKRDSFPDLAMESSLESSESFSALLEALASSPFADLVFITFDAEYSKMKIGVSETQIIME